MLITLMEKAIKRRKDVVVMDFIQFLLAYFHMDTDTNFPLWESHARV